LRLVKRPSAGLKIRESPMSPIEAPRFDAQKMVSGMRAADGKLVTPRRLGVTNLTQSRGGGRIGIAQATLPKRLEKKIAGWYNPVLLGFAA
jgi:hypothetical protein